MTATHYLERPDNRDLRHIPGDYGLPLVGNALALSANPLKFCDERFRLVIDRRSTGRRRKRSVVTSFQRLC